jgi:hypothetical protein
METSSRSLGLRNEVSNSFRLSQQEVKMGTIDKTQAHADLLKNWVFGLLQQGAEVAANPQATRWFEITIKRGH